MGDDDFSFEELFPVIPKEFHCFETGKPFETCLECRLPLADQVESPYYISKAFRRGETILEWALCGDCAQRFREDISIESRERIQKFLGQAKSGEEHMMRPPIKKTSYCFICTKDRKELDGFTIQAICSGDELLNMLAPLLVCHQCEEEAGELLSKATRDHYERFFADNFPGPPAEGVDLPSRKPVLI